MSYLIDEAVAAWPSVASFLAYDSAELCWMLDRSEVASWDSDADALLICVADGPPEDPEGDISKLVGEAFAAVSDLRFDSIRFVAGRADLPSLRLSGPHERLGGAAEPEPEPEPAASAPRPPTGPCVYFIGDDAGRVKIGHTSQRIGKRLSGLQTGNALKLRLLAWTPGAAEDERALHAAFTHLHIRGEWFTLNDEVRAFLATLPGGAL